MFRMFSFKRYSPCPCMHHLLLLLEFACSLRCAFYYYHDCIYCRFRFSPCPTSYMCYYESQLLETTTLTLAHNDGHDINYFLSELSFNISQLFCSVSQIYALEKTMAIALHLSYFFLLSGATRSHFGYV